ncbi:MAG TPA: hypothetical protein VGF12_19025 [Roseateles sp.]|uniref:hypothetical protein n=1 Tax=Roseateles sp. TaxID=1971397 RepID=UPI002ED9A7E8
MMRIFRSAALGALVLQLAMSAPALAQGASSPDAAQNLSTAGAKLKLLFEEDQVDRVPAPGKDWAAVTLRDEARQQRVKTLIANGSLSSGVDYYHAAMVMQHATDPDDYLMAHDLCVVAISKGEHRAKWLAAASLDRFLVSIGRPQRFGTQFSSNHPSRPMKLRPVDPSVPDQLRVELNVPTLAQAKARELSMARGSAGAKPVDDAAK